MAEEAWYYFLSIEKDFVRTIDFVFLSAANGKAYSHEYAKLLLLIGSEVDVIAKRLCKKVSPSDRAENIDDYRKVITNAFPGMHEIEIDIARFGLKIKPWLSWSGPSSPDWWRAYNNVKHERDKNFPNANQENTLNALCGELALLLYLFKEDPHLQPYPDILNYGFPDYMVTEGGKKLPGT